VAKALNRKYIGFELNKLRKKHVRERL